METVKFTSERCQIQKYTNVKIWNWMPIVITIHKEKVISYDLSIDFDPKLKLRKSK